MRAEFEEAYKAMIDEIRFSPKDKEQMIETVTEHMLEKKIEEGPDSHGDFYK